MKPHFKFKEIFTLVNAGIATLLTGEKGCGKTTICAQLAKELDIPFYSLSMTRQTTLSHILGFININGDYVPSQLRKAADEGGLFLADEIDASDPNVILCLNTIENGYISFPDGVVQLHPDFRFVATANPQNKHNEYVGRAKLDASTLDRFDIVHIPLDTELEKSLVDTDTFNRVNFLRELLEKNHVTKISVSMRDSLRYCKRKSLNIHEGYFENKLGDVPDVLEQYTERFKKPSTPKSSKGIKSFEDLVDSII